MKSLLRRSAVLSDCYILPDRRSRPGDTWHVEGSSWGVPRPDPRGIPDGEVVIGRGQDEWPDGKQYASSGIEGGAITVIPLRRLNTSDWPLDAGVR